MDMADSATVAVAARLVVLVVDSAAVEIANKVSVALRVLLTIYF